MAESVFFRGRSAYLVGTAFRAGDELGLPLGLALLHGETGVTLDAVLMGETDIAILFSFTRSYFRVDAARPYELVRFLKTLMPRKRLAEIYTAIGYKNTAKPNSTVTSCATFSPPKINSRAEGARGMVMVVFTLPSYDVVFKLIKDRFDYPKDSSRSEVMRKYRLVFKIHKDLPHQAGGRHRSAHGSSYASGNLLVNTVSPKAAVASVGFLEHSYRLPWYEDVLDRRLDAVEVNKANIPDHDLDYWYNINESTKKPITDDDISRQIQ